MARVRKVNPKTDGDSFFSLSADSSYGDSRLFLIGGGATGRYAYFTVAVKNDSYQTTGFAAFSGRKTLRKFAHAILKATGGGKQ